MCDAQRGERWMWGVTFVDESLLLDACIKVAPVGIWKCCVKRLWSNYGVFEYWAEQKEKQKVKEEAKGGQTFPFEAC